MIDIRCRPSAWHAIARYVIEKAVYLTLRPDISTSAGQIWALYAGFNLVKNSARQ
jgi:hypothetical protein